jgi:HAD superfamily hydrolase (TIGR01509 family)
MLKVITFIQALIWDMDGTLSDTEPLHFLAYQQVLSRFGIRFTEADYAGFLGATDRAFCETACLRYSLPITWLVLLAEKELILADLIKQQAVPRPGVVRMLETARRFKVRNAVASSATTGTIELTLPTLGIKNYFDAIASGEEVQNSKPAPDVFLLAAKRLGIAPTHCLVLEDSIHGVHAARAAGMHCLAVPCDSTRGQDHSGADLRLDSYEQVIPTETGFLAGPCQINLA